MYAERLSVVERSGKLYMVRRCRDIRSGNYVVWASEALSRSSFLGEHRCTPRPPARILEIRGRWEWANWVRRTLSADGSRIDSYSRFPSGYEIRGSWTRTCWFRDLPRLARIDYEYRGLVRLGEEIAAG